MTLLRPYPAYKPSEIDWMGDIPTHWKSTRIGSVLFERNETNEDGREVNILSVMSRIGVIPYEEKGNVGNKASEDISRYKIVRQGDLVVNSMNVIIGSVGISQYDGCLSPVYYVLGRNPRKIAQGYAGLIFANHVFQRSLVRLGNGILSHRMRIPIEKLRAEVIPLPPLDEQRAIADFLDAMDERATRFIAARRRMIALLEEQKQAIVNQAVTRGLDPDVPLKPSGVEWLGDIPAHWSTTTLCRAATVRASNVDKHVVDGEHPVRLCNYTDVYYNKHITSDLRFNNGTVTTEELHRFKLAAGDVLITKDSETWDDIAVPAIVMEDFEDVVCGYHLSHIRPDRGLDGCFLGYWIGSRAGSIHFKVSANGVTRYGLSANDIKSVHVPLPPIGEQRAIADYLDQLEASIDSTIRRQLREIDLIQEYRTRLISDVVTGKLDVRQEAASSYHKHPREY